MTLSSTLTLGGAALAQSAQAPAVSQRSFSVPAGSLASALVAFGKQAGVQVSYVPSLATGLQTSGVTGTLSTDAALSQLLAGTGLSFKMSGTKTVVIEGAGGGSSGTATIPGAIALDTIDVSGGNAASGAGFQGTPDWVYETPSSVSVVTSEAIKSVPARNMRDAIATAPGVYAGEGNGSFPTVSPNIRGLQDSGRIVVSIDGARQNAQRGFGNGASGYQSNSGQAYVDGAFVREVNITKNPEAKAGSAGSLGGGVNFRTVGADDLIPAGHKWGMETNITRGTNEYDFQGSALLATRIGESLSLTGGVSKLELGEYKPGQNGGETGASGSFKGRDAWSSFLKLEGAFGDVKTSLSWMHQENDFQYGSEVYTNGENVRNDSATARLSWKPDNALIDANASFWISDTMTNETRAARPTAPETEIDMGFTSFGGVLENTSRIDTAAGGLKLNYGVEAFHDKATAEASSTTLAKNPTWASSYIAFGPPGKRDVASSFLNGELKPADWVTLSGGIRYDWSRLHGTPTYYNRQTTSTGGNRIVGSVTNYLAYVMQYNQTSYNLRYAICTYGEYNGRVFTQAQRDAACAVLNTTWPNTRGEIIDGRWYDAGVTYYGTIYTTTEPAYTLDIDRTDGAWLPSATIELKPVDWFRPYVSYSHSFRPPTITEAFFVGGPPGDFLGLAYAPNVDLRPETARTWEIGANIIRDGLLDDRDSFRFKAVAFQREIDDYIVLGDIVTQEVTLRSTPYLSFVNSEGTTTMRGIELEGNYDLRFAWLGAAASWLDTDWAEKTQIFSNGVTTTTGEIFAVAGAVPPEFKLVLDGGVRLLDERLQIGARYTHVAPTLQRILDDQGGLRESTEPYSTIDLYGSLSFNEHTMLRFAVNNVTDINYIPATAAYNAPGRTSTIGFQIKY
jgi:hemoglobin/transferrin/lactoferrin receptor protein